MTLQNTAIVISVILIVSFAIYYYTSTKENYVMHPLSARIERVAVTGNKTTSIPLEENTSQTSFMAVPSFQSMIAPRFQSTPNSTFIRYKPTEYKNTAVPKSPLGYVNENFIGTVEGGNACPQCKNYGCGDTCSQTGMSTSSMITNGINKYSTTNMSTSSTSPSKPVIVDAIPVGTMTMSSGVDGETPQQDAVIYDRMIYTTLKNRLQANTDSIRGDLAIAPSNDTTWRTSASFSPMQTLRVGYLQSIAGSNIDNNQSMADLMLKYGGNASLIGGFGTNNTTTTLSQSGDTSVAVTAFP